MQNSLFLAFGQPGPHSVERRYILTLYAVPNKSNIISDVFAYISRNKLNTMHNDICLNEISKYLLQALQKCKCLTFSEKIGRSFLILKSIYHLTPYFYQWQHKF